MVSFLFIEWLETRRGRTSSRPCYTKRRSQWPTPWASSAPGHNRNDGSPPSKRSEATAKDHRVIVSYVETLTFLDSSRCGFPSTHAFLSAITRRCRERGRKRTCASGRALLPPAPSAPRLSRCQPHVVDRGRRPLAPPEERDCIRLMAACEGMIRRHVTAKTRGGRSSGGLFPQPLEQLPRSLWVLRERTA